MTQASYKHPDDLVVVTRDGDVSVVTMNEPERRNPFSLAMRYALQDAFNFLFHEDHATRAIVLTGSGEHFCAGGDLSEMTETPPLLAMRDRIRIGADLFRLIYTGAKPVVAAVEGSCIGAGLSLACASDLVVASNTARFGCAFVKVGLLPDTGLLWTLPQKVGHGRARELMLDARRFGTDEALAWGVVNDTAEPGEALKVALATARNFAQFPPVTLSLLKGALINGMNTVEDAWREEIDLNPLVRQTQDHLEAVKAFMEKREPVFTGN